MRSLVRRRRRRRKRWGGCFGMMRPPPKGNETHFAIGGNGARANIELSDAVVRWCEAVQQQRAFPRVSGVVSCASTSHTRRGRYQTLKVVLFREFQAKNYYFPVCLFVCVNKTSIKSFARNRLMSYWHSPLLQGRRQSYANVVN